jgi:hypothetical protein
MGLSKVSAGAARAVVNCVYYDPVADQFWVIDYRIFDPDRDGKTKLDHVRQMLISAIHRGLLFGYVLMDSWYATTEMMKLLISKHKIFYCPLKSNRKVDDSQGKSPYRAVSKLDWSETELAEGKLIKLNKFPLDVKVKLFRVEVSTDRTDWLKPHGRPRNDLSQESTQAAQQESSLRWKIDGAARAAASPGGETTDGHRQMSVSSESKSTQSYCSGQFSMDSFAGVGLWVSNERLQT